MKYKETVIYIVSIIVIIGVILGIYGYKKSTAIPQEALDQFAQCIASKKITMYGAEWCTHCKAEKARFGSAFQYIPYVECPDNQKLCLDKGVDGYPTWITDSGEKYPGEQGLEGLARISGCALPEKK